MSRESAPTRVIMSSYESPVDEETLFSLREPYVGYATVSRISEELHEPFIDPVTNTPTMGDLFFRYLDLKYEKNGRTLNFRVKIFSDLEPKINLNALGAGDSVFLIGDGNHEESGFLWFSPRYLAAVNEITQVLVALKDHDVTGLPISLVNAKFKLQF